MFVQNISDQLYKTCIFTKPEYVKNSQNNLNNSLIKNWAKDMIRYAAEKDIKMIITCKYVQYY